RLSINAAGQLVYEHYRNNIGRLRIVTGTTNLADGQFHHIAAVTLQPDVNLNRQGALRIYVDGNLEGEYVETDPAFLSQSWGSAAPGEVKLGISTTDYTGNRSGVTFTPLPSFQGVIDELALYSQTLSSTEIGSIYAASGGSKVITGNANGVELDSNA